MSERPLGEGVNSFCLQPASSLVTPRVMRPTNVSRSSSRENPHFPALSSLVVRHVPLVGGRSDRSLNGPSQVAARDNDDGDGDSGSENRGS